MPAFELGNGIQTNAALGSQRCAPIQEAHIVDFDTAIAHTAASCMSQTMIERLPGRFPTRCRAVIHGGIVSLVAVAAEKSASLYDQTRSALADVDRTLVEAGTSKANILSATVYITDMTAKEEMNRAWDEWADTAAPPMRACIAVAALTGDSLIEIMITAAAF
jgi:enamine deaminase RidA (YjgF/YER057c/UK114 family)